MSLAHILAVLPVVVSECPEPSREPQLEILGAIAGSVREMLAGSPSTDPAVVALVDDTGAFCTGTLISPTVVITAAHCFDTPLLGDLRIYFGNDARPGSRDGQEVRATEVLVHPRWGGRIDGYLNDLTLIRLAAPVAVTPKPLVSAGTTDRLTGSVMRIVGFGNNGVDHGVKLEGLARINGVDDSTLTHLPEPTATCSGDSGGPGFVIENGREVLAAVHSRGSCGSGTGESLKMRVDVFRDFIDPFLAAPGPSGPAVVIAPPAPSRTPVPPPVLTPEPPGSPTGPALRNPNDPDELFVHGLWHFQTRDFATGCGSLRRYLAIAPTGRHAQSVRANILPVCDARAPVAPAAVVSMNPVAPSTSTPPFDAPSYPVLRNPDNPEELFLHSLWYFQARDFQTGCTGFKRYLDIAPSGIHAGSIRTNLLPACRERWPGGGT